MPMTPTMPLQPFMQNAPWTYTFDYISPVIPENVIDFTRSTREFFIELESDNPDE
jgi:hypothetical protein